MGVERPVHIGGINNCTSRLDGCVYRVQVGTSQSCAWRRGTGILAWGRFTSEEGDVCMLMQVGLFQKGRKGSGVQVSMQTVGMVVRVDARAHS